MFAGHEKGPIGGSEHSEITAKRARFIRAENAHAPDIIRRRV
jgi:hypothetical protein